MNRKTLSHHLFFFGLLLLAAGLPLSKSAMSIGQMVLGAGWFLAGNYGERLGKLWKNKSALAVLSYFFLLLAGMAYSTDFKNALNDIRIKLPLFILPFIIATSEPLDEKKFRMLTGVFIFAVFAGTIISLAVLFGFIKKNITDIRDISIFISHIRFSLMICLCIFILGVDLTTGRAPKERGVNLTPGPSPPFGSAQGRRERGKEGKKNILLVLLTVWFCVFLVILESVTVIEILLGVSLILLLIFLFKTKNFFLRIGVVTVLTIIPAGIFFFIKQEVDSIKEIKMPDVNLLEKKSPRGNEYDHRPGYGDYENGNPVYMYISRIELMEEWQKRSDIPFDGKDRRGQFVEYTLMRFLTSKGLRKDAGGVLALSDKEVKSIERGVANVNYQDITNFSQRIRQIVWELKSFSQGGNPSGHSVSQRLEFWRASLGIIRENILFGVGTGDIRVAFEQQYKEMNSKLNPEKRMKSHNEYLLTAVGFGLFGLGIFVFSLTYPLFAGKKMNDYLYLVFLLTVSFSMLTEDTLETQAGATFFAFFNSLLLFGRKGMEVNR